MLDGEGVRCRLYFISESYLSDKFSQRHIQPRWNLSERAKLSIFQVIYSWPGVTDAPADDERSSCSFCWSLSSLSFSAYYQWRGSDFNFYAAQLASLTLKFRLKPFPLVLFSTLYLVTLPFPFPLFLYSPIRLFLSSSLFAISLIPSLCPVASGFSDRNFPFVHCSS